MCSISPALAPDATQKELKGGYDDTHPADPERDATQKELKGGRRVCITSRRRAQMQLRKN